MCQQRACLHSEQGKLRLLSTCIASPAAHLITTWSWPFDLSVERLSCAVCLPSLVLISEAVFLSEGGHTDRQTSRQIDFTFYRYSKWRHWPTSPLARPTETVADCHKRDEIQRFRRVEIQKNYRSLNSHCGRRRPTLGSVDQNEIRWMDLECSHHTAANVARRTRFIPCFKCLCRVLKNLFNFFLFHSLCLNQKWTQATVA